ncbi:MAG: hypothetical protein HYV38_01975 [Candidatus Levybacteria bacterium]|nr:hypothetical protein [Candidatus Levybacteria bacterium]MBI2420828.1 hypothetical protein [Candidatus Levybacteria bacterium]
MSSILFTEEGYKKLKSELKTAEEKRPKALKSLVRSRELGDLSENGAYKSARFELSDLDRKIRQLKYLILNGKPVSKPKNNKFVQFGHAVILKRIN